MRSIREVYKIGKGPSSSHTMGPAKAAELFRSENPDADSFRVILYGSLAKTGRGHGTDRAVISALAPIPAEVKFSPELPAGATHPNTLDLFAFKAGQETAHMRVQSIGGGDIAVEGRPSPESEEVYPESSFAEIRQFCSMRKVDLARYVVLNEGEEILDYLAEVWQAMQACIREGLSREGELPGGLHIQRKAKGLLEAPMEHVHPEVEECRTVCAYAYACSEQNADNGTVVTAPTCGSCGVLPAVLYYFKQKKNLSDDDVIKALAVAGLFGNLAKCNASVSGAECGCQAEIGVACAMAAAAAGQIFGYTLDQIEYAAEISVEHHLGLTCDPICGLVQIPCIERNAVAAMRAINAANLSYFLSDTRSISYDLILRSMYQTGKDINHRYRETSEGGLAAAYTRRG